MCQYCAKVKDEDAEFSYFVDEEVKTDNDITVFSLDGTMTSIENPVLWITVYLGNKGEELIDSFIPIHYCPFCGEKLI